MVLMERYRKIQNDCLGNEEGMEAGKEGRVGMMNISRPHDGGYGGSPAYVSDLNVENVIGFIYLHT